jgi:type IV pilus assembly protein PilO
MQLSDFNNIDLKNAGNLPVPMKAALLAILAASLLLLGYLFFVESQSKGVESRKRKRAGLAG